MTASDTVMRLIGGFNDKDMDTILGCFDDASVYHNIPMESVTGVDAIRGVLEGLVAGASRIQWDVLFIAERDNVVLTERVDKFELNGNWIELPVMGTFEVTGDTITAWRDYFDLADFQKQMAAAAGG